MGIVSSIVENGLGTVQVTSHSFFSIFDALGVSPVDINRLWDSIEEVKSNIERNCYNNSPDKIGYYLGGLIADAGLIVAGTAGAIEGLIKIVTGTGGIAASLGLAVGSGGAGIGIAVLTSVASATTAAYGAGIIVASGNLVATSTMSFIKDWDSLRGSAKKPSLKRINSNKEANRIAEKFGYRNAEDFKESYVGKGSVKRFNIYYDSKTRELILVSISDSSVQVPTGLLKP